MLIFFQTTLAHIIANRCKKDNQEARFVTMSATMSGVSDVKDAVKIAKNELRSFKRRTILFMDEIHRFNKLQQVMIDTLTSQTSKSNFILQKCSHYLLLGHYISKSRNNVNFPKNDLVV